MKKILFFGNGAQMNYVIIKYLRKYTDYKPDLLLQDYNHPFLDHPAWEDLMIKIPQQTMKFNFPEAKRIFDEAISVSKWIAPNWIKQNPIKYSICDKFLTKYIDKSYTQKKQIKHYVKDLKKYDLVISDGFGAISAINANVQFAIRPYGADLDIFPFDNDFRGKMVRRAYENCKVILGQHQMGNLSRISGAQEKLLPIAVVIDTEKLIPKKFPKKDKLTFFLASRLWFEGKGSDKAIRAFKRILKSYDAHLYCLEYGTDVDRTRQLIRDLDIEKNVTFYNFVASKSVLVELYQIHDAIIGNLNIGAVGTTELEAMSCDKPVIAHVDLLGELEKNMPVLNACSEDEIYSKMIAVCENRNIPIGMRKYVEKYYGFENFLQIFHNLIEKLN